MSLLDTASLLLTPNAYKEGKLYSVIPSNGNGDFTATRATTATRVNSAGLVDLVPYNLVQYSEMFADAYWSKNFSTISANVAIAPNGTLTADKLIPNATNNFHSINSPSNLTTTNTTATFSVYMKADGYNFGNLLIASSGSYTKFFEGVFNLSNGTIEATGRAVGGYTGTRSIESVGNGWYRCSITLTNADANSTHLVNVTTQPTNNPNLSYIGNGASGILVWGAQFEMGLQTTYLRTETRLNIPRVDYSLGGCPNILLEPQRTNLALQSSSFDNASWTKNNTTATANTTTSPSGIVDADTLTADGTTSLHITQQSISVVNATSYTISVYAKKNTNNFIQILLGSGTFGVNVWANFDLNNGVVGSVGSATTARIENVGNGWYRCTITGVATSTSVNGASGFLIVSSATSPRAESNTLSTSVFIWGAQFEAGAYATSYIPTTTASVTRNADTLTRNNIFTNGLITASGGTWFVELRNNRLLAYSNEDVGAGLELGNNSIPINALKFRRGAGTQRVNIWKVESGTSSQMYSLLTDNAKVAIKWNGSTADVFVNGVKVVSATSFTPTNMDFLRYIQNQFPTYLNEMALFPTPLTDAQCIALTQ